MPPKRKKSGALGKVFLSLLFVLQLLIFSYKKSSMPNIFPNDLLDEDRIVENSSKSANSFSTAPSRRLERMKMYQERYRYQPPAQHTNHTARDEICGSYPHYKEFFSLNKYMRSDTLNKEDYTIYKTFFEKYTSDKSSAPIKGSVVEMGAYDGLQQSNSRFFEECLGWETMLVEGNPMMYDKLFKNRPHAHRFSYVPSCTEEEEIANKTIRFDKYPATNGGVADGSVTTAYTVKNWYNDAPCGSLTKVLLDLFPNGHVSFFSLDVEGAEPMILRQLDFDKVFIEIMMVENRNTFCKKVCKSRDEFRKIMSDAGYILFPNLVRKSDVFIHPLSTHLKTAQDQSK